MPCPLFLPERALDGYYSGQCSADRDTAISDDKLRDCCNRGYAREICDQAATAEADAAQFLIQSDRDGTIEVAWSLERDHHPVAVGVIAVSHARCGTSPIEAQAIALAMAYLRHKGSVA